MWSEYYYYFDLPKIRVGLARTTATILMRAFCNTGIDFQMEMTLGGHYVIQVVDIIF